MTRDFTAQPGCINDPAEVAEWERERARADAMGDAADAMPRTTPIEILESDAVAAALHRQWHDLAPILAGDSERAIAAVRELVAADRELDAARASFRASGRCGGRERARRFDREQAAIARRARALSAFGDTTP